MDCRVGQFTDVRPMYFGASLEIKNLPKIHAIVVVPKESVGKRPCSAKAPTPIFFHGIGAKDNTAATAFPAKQRHQAPT